MVSSGRSASRPVGRRHGLCGVIGEVGLDCRRHNAGQKPAHAAAIAARGAAVSFAEQHAGQFAAAVEDRPAGVSLAGGHGQLRPSRRETRALAPHTACTGPVASRYCPSRSRQWSAFRPAGAAGRRTAPAGRLACEWRWPPDPSRDRRSESFPASRSRREMYRDRPRRFVHDVPVGDHQAVLAGDVHERSRTVGDTALAGRDDPGHGRMHVARWTASAAEQRIAGECPAPHRLRAPGTAASRQTTIARASFTATLLRGG